VVAGSLSIFVALLSGLYKLQAALKKGFISGREEQGDVIRRCGDPRVVVVF
jgi:hypothetical protein